MQPRVRISCKKFQGVGQNMPGSGKRVELPKSGRQRSMGLADFGESKSPKEGTSGKGLLSSLKIKVPRVPKLGRRHGCLARGGTRLKIPKVEVQPLRSQHSLGFPRVPGVPLVTQNLLGHEHVLTTPRTAMVKAWKAWNRGEPPQPHQQQPQRWRQGVTPGGTHLGAARTDAARGEASNANLRRLGALQAVGG